MPHAPADGGAGGIFPPGRFAYTADRDGYDYSFTRWERLAELGARSSTPNNHINRFVENNPTWTYEEVTPATLPECLEMDKEGTAAPSSGRETPRRDLETRNRPAHRHGAL